MTREMPDAEVVRADWSWADMKRPMTAVGALASSVGVGFISLATACNVHELGHGVVATALGWKVERINLCLPRGGSVEFSHVGTWAGNAQGYAGGVAAALFLLGMYAIVFQRRKRPLRNPFFWAAGLATVLFIGPQLVIAILEGVAGPGEDYTERFRESPEVLVPLVVFSGLGGAAAYTWRWRSVWRRDHTEPSQLKQAG